MQNSGYTYTKIVIGVYLKFSLTGVLCFLWQPQSWLLLPTASGSTFEHLPGWEGMVLNPSPNHW